MARLTSALFALALLVPGGAAAAASPAEGSLTPELEQLSTPVVAESSPEEQAEAIGLPAEGPGSLSREGDRVVVEAHFEAGALARLEALEAAGAQVMVASARYQTVALSVEPEDLEAVAGVAGVDLVEPSLRPMVYATEGGASTSAGGASAICEGGSVVSRGYEQLNVKSARETFGTRGRGITVGVLSDSFNAATRSDEGGTLAAKAENDEASDDLPGSRNGCSGQQVPVRVLADVTPGAGEETHDEGRAMLQVVHDLAPHAQLAFATAYGSELEFARNIERLAEPVASGGAGAQVIVDDVAYYNEPFYQEGPVADAIRRVTEAGVTYLTAAGNDNLFEKGTSHEIGSWEREKFANTTCPSVLSSRVRGGSSSCLGFSPSKVDPTFGITVEPESRLLVDLQWAEPWYGVTTDLDAYLLNAKETEVLAPRAPLRPLDNVTEGGEGEGGNAFSAPVEVLGWENTSQSAVEVRLVVDRCIGTCDPAAATATEPRVKVALLENGGGVEATEYHESVPAQGIIMGPTVFGHAGSSSAVTVGAIRYSESKTSPKEPEPYSSRGPFTAYFGPVEGTTPAAKLPTPEAVSKPDITATDCASTTFFAQLVGGQYYFCGTSEAAPHAAAVAALMKQTRVAGTTAIREAMQKSATAFTKVTSKYAVGAGLLNAAGALTALGGTAVEDPASALVNGGAAETTPEEGSSQERLGTGTETQKETPVTPTPNPTPRPAPVVSVTKGPASIDNESRPSFEFSASLPSTFTCQIDGAAPQSCNSPYVAPSALSDGQHGFAVTATDSEGRSGASNTYYFTVDTKAPRARIVGHPAKLVKTRKATYVARFRLTADQSPVTYYCQLDREPLRVCGAATTVRVKPGAHVLKVRAKDALGNTSATPSTYRFKVKRALSAHSSGRSRR